jgi:nucleotide-binding universal stress UspA family protein
MSKDKQLSLGNDKTKKSQQKRHHAKEPRTKPVKNFKVKTILLALGNLRSKKALDIAIYFAKQLEASITIVKVIPVIPLAHTTLIKKLKNEMEKEAVEILDIARKYCLRKKISSKIKIMYGDEPDSIVKASRGHDMIIIGSHGKGLTEELFFGSISNKVSHKSNLPVLLVKFS